MIANTFRSIKMVTDEGKSSPNVFTFILHDMATGRTLLLNIKSRYQHWAMMEAQRYERKYEYTYVEYIGKNNEIIRR